MFGKELTKKEILLAGVIIGFVAERGINKFLTWRTEVARARLYAANPDLARLAQDHELSNIKRQSQAFKARHNF